VRRNRAVAREAKVAEIRVSDRALQRIAEILKGESAGSALRVSVEGGGCSGFQYKFDIDARVEADDLVLGPASAPVLVDSVSQPFLEGAEIDFVDDLMGQSFRIQNPNATSSCGCGVSFSV
jgi:iron-sulfur cluster assembly accessory protein